MRDLLGNKFCDEENEERKAFKAHGGPFDKRYVMLDYNRRDTGTLAFSVPSYKNGERGRYTLHAVSGLIWVPQA